MSDVEVGRMGTTTTMALVIGPCAYFAHAGHSRAYLWRDDQIRQLTRDHSLAARLAEGGIISDIEIATHPRNNILFRAVGRQQALEVDIFDCSLQPGDRLLLCSDGLWKAFPDPEELSDWLGAVITPDELCWCLVEEAISRDGSDDTSAIVVFVGDQPAQGQEIYQVASQPADRELPLPA